jgi:aminopeptidase C
VNPFDAEPSLRRTVAHLLQGPAQDFVDWASNCAIADKLPVHALMPDWVATAQSRLHLCVGYQPEKTMDGIDDAVEFLGMFKL